MLPPVVAVLVIYLTRRPPLRQLLHRVYQPSTHGPRVRPLLGRHEEVQQPLEKSQLPLAPHLLPLLVMVLRHRLVHLAPDDALQRDLGDVGYDEA